MVFYEEEEEEEEEEEKRETRTIVMTTIRPPQRTKKPKGSSRNQQPPPPKKRVITKTPLWTNTDISMEKQGEYIEYLYRFFENQPENTKAYSLPPHPHRREHTLLLQNIRQKIGGYKTQDTYKKLRYKEEKEEEVVVNTFYVLQLLHQSHHSCYYCKNPVQVLYENVREPQQWTLERIDNSIGHMAGNMVISCLKCNLRRKNMNPEKYVFTKQVVLIKTG